MWFFYTGVASGWYEIEARSSRSNITLLPPIPTWYFACLPQAGTWYFVQFGTSFFVQFLKNSMHAYKIFLI
jgi:hypothetical protein